jgi:hypothetical protein
MGDRFSLVLTPEVAAMVEEARAATGEETAALLRKAIRAGLPLVKSGGEAVSLDGEISRDVGNVAQWHGWTRAKVMLEAIRLGLPAVHARWAAYHNATKSDGSPVSPEESERLIATDPDAHPLRKENIRLRGHFRAAQQMLDRVRAHPDGEKALIELEAQDAELRAKGILTPFGLNVNPPMASADAGASAASPKRDVPGTGVAGPVTAAKPASAKPAKRKTRRK